MIRKSIWENSGKAVNATTWQDAASSSGLDFTVEKIPQINALTGDNLDNYFGLYREDTFDCLSIVGSSYEVCQPSTMFSFLDVLGGEGANFTRAGFFGKGEKIFCQMNLGSFDVLGSGDIHSKMLTGLNSFDGSVSETYKTTGVRIVCQNTFEMAIRDKTGKQVKFRHTRNAAQRRNEALAILQSAQNTSLLLQEKFELLAQRKVNSEIVGQTIAQIFNIDIQKELTPQNAEKVMLFQEIFELNDNNAFPEFRGTAYNLLNAATEYADHFKTVKLRGETESAKQRAFSSIFGSGAELKEKAMNVVLELTKDAPSTNQPAAYSYSSGQDLVAELLNHTN